MSVKKVPIKTDRIRQIPRSGFSWIDRRFVRNKHINALPREAIILYFFLTTVADDKGMSFYADPTVRQILKLEQQDLLYARNRLVKASLIAYRYPLYQVLELPVKTKVADKKQTYQKQKLNSDCNSIPMEIGKIVEEVLGKIIRPTR